MAEDNKKFYWIKLKTNFFNQEAIDFLMSQENGCKYIVLYQMLCLQTANNNGEMSTKIGEMIVPYDVNKIVRDTKYFDVDTVIVAMELFKNLGLIYEEEKSILRIADFEELVGSETKWAEQKRIYREKQKQITSGQIKGQIEDNVLQEIRDKSIEIRDKKIENKKENIKEKRHQYGEYKNVLLTDEELEKLKVEFSNDWKNRIEKVSEYCAKTGRTYKNYLATIRSWARNDQKKEASKNENQFISGDLPF